MGDAGLPRRLARDPVGASLDAPDRAMLDYALKLTARPGTVGAKDVEPLREAGFQDRAVLDVCQVAAYYAYVNRLADGLGVELEPWWKEEELTLTPAEFEALKARRREHPERWAV